MKRPFDFFEHYAMLLQMSQHQDNTTNQPLTIARIILSGFDKHYQRFRGYGDEARVCFENTDWARIGEASKERILSYDTRVTETVDTLAAGFPEASHNTDMWPEIKAAFIALLMNHLQSECAESYYNSVACRVLHRDYFNNENIFWRPALSTEHLKGSAPSYRSYYPPTQGLRRCLLEMLTSFKIDVQFQNLRRDVRRIEKSIRGQRSKTWKAHPNHQLQVLSSLFYRNKGAYIVCRLVNGDRKQALVLPLLKDDQQKLFVDAALMRDKDVSIVFSFSRAYFMVDMEVPSAYVSFLTSIMPGKSPVDLYAMLGLQKQAKTLLYREMQHHLTHSQDNFQIAPGVRGMVMLVFALPSFPFVFKLIRDFFEPPKTSSREDVRGKYQLVKNHDRVGRMADTLEYSNVAIPLERIEPALMEDLKATAKSSIEVVGENLVIKHIYIERRMEPLDRFLAQTSPELKLQAIKDFGQAIRDLAGANIFPGDMLKKNFGMTRTGRVVFYDYDEIAYITDCNFREIPAAKNYDDEISDTPWFSIGAHDVFPESFGPFFFARQDDLALFKKDHAELLTAKWWDDMKQSIHEGKQKDLFPYKIKRRFSEIFE